MTDKTRGNNAAVNEADDHDYDYAGELSDVRKRLSLEANPLKVEPKRPRESDSGNSLQISDVFQEIDRATSAIDFRAGLRGGAMAEKPGPAKDVFVAQRNADKPGVEVGSKKGDGTVLVNGEAVDGGVPKRTEKKVVNSDGSFIRDENNRIVSSESADGKVKRKFEYDPKDPNKILSVTENGVVYKNLGPIKYSNTGKSVFRDGYEMNSWSIYDEGQKLPKGNWYGAREISSEGVFTTRDDRTGELKFQDAAGAELTKQQADERNKVGIWPSLVAVERPDGSRVEGRLKGTSVESFVEERDAQGAKSRVTWSRDGANWTSDEKPPRTRTEVSLSLAGDLSYKTGDRDGSAVVEFRNGQKTVTINGVTDRFNLSGDRTGVDTADGALDLSYGSNSKGEKMLVEIASRSNPPLDAASKWTRKDQSDEWISADGKSEIRKDLKVLANGDFEFTDKDGRRVSEKITGQRINYDDSNRPLLVKFPSGATREFNYDKEGLSSFKDSIPTAGHGNHEIEWKRDGDKFVSTREGGKQYTRAMVSVSDGADVNYVGSDNKPHTARVRDIDRIARGEFVLGSESLLEARDKLSEAVKNSGINYDRFNNWMKEFETRAGSNKLPQDKVVKTFNSLADILLSSDRSPHFDLKQKETLVETAMHNLARPLEIDQGSHPTCNVSSVEIWAAVIHPDQYTRLLKEVALSGSWTTTEGRKFSPTTNYRGTDPNGQEQVYNSIKPGKDELKYDVGKPDSGDRNLASQVLQMTLINAMYEHGHMNKVDGEGKLLEDRTNIRYVMGPNRTRVEYQGGTKIEIDEGEDILMRDGKPVLGKSGKVAEGGPGFVQDNVLKSAVLLTGEEPPYIKCAGFFDNPQTGRREYFNDLVSKEQLLKFKAEGRMPVLTPTMGGNHAQTIHDVWENPKNGELWILLDNQHGEPEVKGTERKSGEGDGDGWITLATLHDTLKMSDQGAQFGKPVMPSVHKYSHPKTTVK